MFVKMSWLILCACVNWRVARHASPGAKTLQFPVTLIALRNHVHAPEKTLT